MLSTSKRAPPLTTGRGTQLALAAQFARRGTSGDFAIAEARSRSRVGMVARRA